MGLKVGEKRWTNVFGNVELKAMKTMEQPTLYQRNIKKHQNFNPN